MVGSSAALFFEKFLDVSVSRFLNGCLRDLPVAHMIASVRGPVCVRKLSFLLAIYSLSMKCVFQPGVSFRKEIFSLYQETEIVRI